MELLIVVAITSVGFVALLNLQVSSIRGLNYPAQLTDAIQLGEHFLATVQAEGMAWTKATGGPPTVGKYLPNVSNTDPAPWQVAYAQQDAPYAFTDLAGDDTDYDSGILREIPGRTVPRFCVHYRLAWATGSQEMIRSEVRVLWLRDDSTWQRFKDCPVSMADPKYRNEVQFIGLTKQISKI